MSTVFRNGIVFFSAAFMVLFATSGQVLGDQSGKEWVIPYVMTQTGPYSAVSGVMADAAKDAVAQINAKGGAGGRPMRLEIYDDAADPAKTVAEMSKLIEDNLIIFGPVIDPAHQAAMPLAQRNKAFLFCTNLSPMSWEKYKGNAITFWPDYETAIGLFAPIWFKNNPGMKNVVTIFDPKNAFLVMTQKLYRKVFEAKGIKILNEVELGEGVDVGAAVIKAMGQKPDGYAIVALPGDTGRVVLELDKRGVAEKKNILMYPTTDSPDFFSTVAGKGDGGYVWNFYDTWSSNPSWVAFVERYAKSHKGMRPGVFAILAQNTAFLAKRAIDDLGLTGQKAKLAEERKKLIDYMANVKNFEGATGTMDIVNYRAKVNPFLFRVKGSTLVLVK